MRLTIQNEKTTTIISQAPQLGIEIDQIVSDIDIPSEQLKRTAYNTRRAIWMVSTTPNLMGKMTNFNTL